LVSKLETLDRYIKCLHSDLQSGSRFSTITKTEIVNFVEQAEIPIIHALSIIGVSRTSFYRWRQKCNENYQISSQHEKSSYIKIYERVEVKELVFKVFHSPPSQYGFNRTTWRMDDLQQAIEREGSSVGKHAIRKVIKGAGFRWLKAKKVLTSKDPEYRVKLNNIQAILGGLKKNEGFFSIDEYGPFAVKQKPGKKLVGPGELFTVPQWQKSKGKLIMTAALELSTNQVTHFYSEKKDTEEMIKLLDILLSEYTHYDRIFLSWDAASWHISKKLFEKIESNNVMANITGSTRVEVAPLPAGAQFLNVIEAIFSGMSRAIIHNSNYQSIKEAKAAIDRYFEERNQYFLDNPKKAGKKIWGQEPSSTQFNESQNCKDPRYR
jgi:transposase